MLAARIPTGLVFSPDALSKDSMGALYETPNPGIEEHTTRLAERILIYIVIKLLVCRYQASVCKPSRPTLRRLEVSLAQAIRILFQN